jgi:5-methylcytosine-specific restriction enzyme subunit McrC
VTASPTSITLREWETRGPDDCEGLAGRFLDHSARTRELVRLLESSRVLGVRELRGGLELQAFAHVGRVEVGDLSVTVLPKIPGSSLLNLVRYAHGFRRLLLPDDATHRVDYQGIEELLISQLNREVQELIARGLFRGYRRTCERLGVLRGRIDLDRITLDGGIMSGTIPCVHHARIADTLLNQVMMAGLRLASSMTSVVELRRESLRLAAAMEGEVSRIRLDGRVMDRVTRAVNRLTHAYTPALSIIRLLVDSKGILLAGSGARATLPGFMFDMNAFFQLLVSRFLRENLPGYVVRDEHALKGMIRYSPAFNPRQQRAPAPRPDFIVTNQGAPCSILDAKYRDLWTSPLPREMLYQLVVYAISLRGIRQSSILYPTMDPLARAARIDVSDLLDGREIGQVWLRPVILPRLEELVGARTLAALRERHSLARQLVLGLSDTTADGPANSYKSHPMKAITSTFVHALPARR